MLTRKSETPAKKLKLDRETTRKRSKGRKKKPREAMLRKGKRRKKRRAKKILNFRRFWLLFKRLRFMVLTLNSTSSFVPVRKPRTT